MSESKTTRSSTSPGAKSQEEVAAEGKEAADDASQPGYSPFDTGNPDPNAPETEEVVTPSEPPLSEEEKAEIPAAGTLVEQKPVAQDPDKGRAEAREQREEYERHTAKAVAEKRLEGDMTPPTAEDAEESKAKSKK